MLLDLEDKFLLIVQVVQCRFKITWNCPNGIVNGKIAMIGVVSRIS